MFVCLYKKDIRNAENNPCKFNSYFYESEFALIDELKNIRTRICYLQIKLRIGIFYEHSRIALSGKIA